MSNSGRTLALAARRARAERILDAAVELLLDLLPRLMRRPLLRAALVGDIELLGRIVRDPVRRGGE